MEDKDKNLMSLMMQIVSKKSSGATLLVLPGVFFILFGLGVIFGGIAISIKDAGGIGMIVGGAFFLAFGILFTCLIKRAKRKKGTAVLLLVFSCSLMLYGILGVIGAAKLITAHNMEKEYDKLCTELNSEPLQENNVTSDIRENINEENLCEGMVKINLLNGQELCCRCLEEIYSTVTGKKELYVVVKSPIPESTDVCIVRKDQATGEFYEFDNALAEKVHSEWLKTKIKVRCLDGKENYFKQIGEIYSSITGKKEFYVVFEPIDESIRVVYVGIKNQNTDEISEMPTDIGSKIYDEWRKSTKKQQPDTCKLKFDMYDVIVSASDWKRFRRSATQDELIALALGAQYMRIGWKFLVKALVVMLGSIGSVLFGILGFEAFGFFSLFVLVGGYLGFSTLGSKMVGYEDTYKSCYRKLTKENKLYVKSYFKCNILMALIRDLCQFVLMLFMIPYQFILVIISTMMPMAKNWAIAHGSIDGAVVVIPKGYDIGGLGELGEYYQSFKFGDAWEQTLEDKEKERLASTKEYSYKDENGITQKAYSTDGNNFYSSSDCSSYQQIGTSKDGSKTIDFN